MNTLREVVELVESLDTPNQVAQAEIEMKGFMQSASPTEQSRVQASVSEQAQLLLEELQELKQELNRYLSISGLDPF